ncbi:MAG: hypothetical protein P8Y58_18405 [Novosphingobium sp.]
MAKVLQAPPNLHAPEELTAVLRAGVNDWGGVSPVTPDHVNPEAPWPHLDLLERATEAAGRVLRERLAIGPAYARRPEEWMEPALAKVVRRSVDARGLPIVDGWHPGTSEPMPAERRTGVTVRSGQIREIVARALEGARLEERDIVSLFEADGPDVALIADAANRNINYTNICLYKCGFCAFSKGTARDLRGPAYKLDFAEIGRRAAEAVERSATEVCLQGGIHPDYDGNTYLNVLRAVRTAAPSIHIHAFSPLEVAHGARTLGLSLRAFLTMLKDEGLSTLPGTAAEVLDDEVRAIICPDKLNTEEWIELTPWQKTQVARHPQRPHFSDYAHALITEFVPLPFVHMEAPIWRRGQARSGPSARETLLMHALARLVLHPLIPNIQTSWVKLGEQGVIAALQSGANDLGGVLMDESITRAAGGVNGQLWDADHMAAIAEAAGRFAVQRTTLYQPAAALMAAAE